MNRPPRHSASSFPMIRIRLPALALIAVLGLAAGASAAPSGDPADRAALGERLFFDPILSADRTVSCGWRSRCPPYSEAAPLRPVTKGTLTDAQVDRLLPLAGSPAFFALPKFNSNPHIIDGGEQQLVVRIGTRTKTVEMANTNAPAFDELLWALSAATGCSRESAGPPPP